MEQNLQTHVHFVGDGLFEHFYLCELVPSIHCEAGGDAEQQEADEQSDVDDQSLALERSPLLVAFRSG